MNNDEMVMKKGRNDEEWCEWWIMIIVIWNDNDNEVMKWNNEMKKMKMIMMK